LIPLRDENPTELTPYVTLLFIALNLAAWLLLQGGGMPEQLEASVWAFGSIPCEVTGACEPQGLAWGAVLTSMFMHGGWGHLLGNMVFLWVFGNNIEDSMGHFRFVLFYLICGVAAALAHIYLSPTSPIPAVGASGAISGIMGAYVVLYPRARVQTFFPPFFFFHLPAFVFLGYWFFIQLSMGVMSLGPETAEQGGVAVWAHVGGFVAGLVLIRLFGKRALVEAKRHGVKLPPSEVARLEW
jgi:membrane associated rhomboid family serine protease